ncbi:MAG: polysaccharide deacetylase family protein [Pseudomonadales bacterium]|nr:polysaccharide deacetylase family protein [Halioglobus sp.]MCP5122942.1 polysaccharide deacetylase family protein [Pseudomonadales bacterium]
MSAITRSFLKKTIVSALGSKVISNPRLRAMRRNHLVTVLNIHRVDDHLGSAYEAIQPALFYEFVVWLKEHFHLTTFRKLNSIVSWDKPVLILSFDDGYRDFIEIVVPMLDSLAVEVNQNIIPDCVDTGRPPISVMIQDFIGTAPEKLLREIAFPGLPNGIRGLDRVRAGLRASAAIKYRPILEQKELMSELEPQFYRFDGYKTTPMMALNQIKEIAPLHEIGVHSFEHATMTAETDEYLVKDASRCLTWFKSNSISEPTVYAFPNGAAHQRHSELLHRNGFPTVLLVGEAFTCAHTWLHKRFTFYAKSLAEARFRATGGLAHTRLPRQPGSLRAI